MEDIKFQSAQHVIDEVRNMNVKGGSPFGRAAAWAYKLAVEQEHFSDLPALTKRIDWIAEQLHALKPTMATIHNVEALVREDLAGLGAHADVNTAKESVANLCDAIIAHSEKAVDALGEYGANCIQDGMTVLMHSYTSSLMSVYKARAARNQNFQVICTESRPLRESRLAATILQKLGVPVTFITDASVWEFLPRADLILVGADSVACDGSVANKMGTAMIARLAQDLNKELVVATELFKLDLRTLQGIPIELERRTYKEVIAEDDFQSLEGITVINQFFDLTPAASIRSLVTEYGTIAPPTVMQYWERLKNQLLGNRTSGGQHA